MKWLQIVKRWLRLVIDPARRYGVRYVDEFPDALASDLVYLVGDTPDPWAATFECPCGCGQAIRLSLVGRDKPSWRARVSSKGRVTLTPSIWRTKGCKSHFFVRDGRVLWAKDVSR